MNVIPEREKLYAEVWSVPMMHLGKRYGLSGSGLRQICVRLSIPVPGRGHWAKLAAGHPVATPPLPALAAGTASKPTLTPRTKPVSPPARAQSGLKAPPPLDPRGPVAQINDTRPSEVHPLIRPLLPLYEKEATEALLRKAKHEWEEAHPGRTYRGVAPPYHSWKYFCDRGQILAATHRKSALRVSLLTYKRALCLMSALIVELEKARYQVSFADHRKRLIAKRDDAHISIRVTEKLDAGTRFDRVNSHTREKEYVKTLSPTGRLTLGIEQMGLGETLICDTSTTALESKWLAILAATEFRHRGSLVAVAGWRKQREDQEESARLRAERQRTEEEARRRKAAEAAKREELLREAQSWQSAQLLRSYVAHLDARRGASGSPAESFDAWRQWALGVAEALDQSGTRLSSTDVGCGWMAVMPAATTRSLTCEPFAAAGFRGLYDRELRFGHQPNCRHITSDALQRERE